MLSIVLSQIPESCKQKPAKIINVHKEFERQLDFKIVKFPARNTIPYLYFKTDKQKKYIDLLVLWNSKNFHYVLIKDFNRFMNNKTKHDGKKNLSILPTMLF